MKNVHCDFKYNPHTHIFKKIKQFIAKILINKIII